MKFLSFLILLITVFSACAQQKENDILIEADPKNYTTELIVPELQIPWGMTWLPDGSMLITEKSGTLIHFKNKIKTTISNVPEVYNRNQGGLLDIELHPKYQENGWIYIAYSSKKGTEKGGNTAIIRAKLEKNQLTNIEELYKGTPNTTKGHHFGSRLEFDTQGYLYFSIGDRGNRDVNPQDITKDGGKVYRLHDDGSIPKDNPFVDKKGAKKAVFSYGHRNPQGMAIHPDGTIWVHEHGPRGGDEINPIKKGLNYGWPTITYGINYSGTSITDITKKEGMQQPLYYWVPSIAPSGMDFVTSDIYPDWKNDLVVGSLKFQYLELLELTNNKVTSRKKLLDGMGRVRNVRQGPDGFIYVAIENKGIVKIIPN
ncbi:PQQ-dependent sugar dehydrogenase [Aquimarina aggregata]|uniref:PQQ-dependent sugar dehydrogenase n=1 Tax=Aquimarina aggregata TaxID=1642818 RepID=UPI00248FC6B3|nr:PQQ-dependent sugar dehydrogenase [Aquimarina aggregata]